MRLHAGEYLGKVLVDVTARHGLEGDCREHGPEVRGPGIKTLGGVAVSPKNPVGGKVP